MKQRGIREAILLSYSVGDFGYRWKSGLLRNMYNALSSVGYAATQRRSPRGMKPIDIDALVEKWMDVVVRLATAHDRDEFDAAESQTDEILVPILKAPVKQLREFYARLLARLKSDRRVPMLVWMGFEAWGECMVKTASDEGVKQLKTSLAKEIADMVEADVQPQIGQAIVNALKWRAPEQLEEVRSQLKSGKRARLKGRESCLFLHVGEACVML